MNRRSRSLLAVLFLLPLAAAAQETPPGAPAVVLSKRGTFSMIDPKTGRFSPSFTVEVRRKILTEEGRKYAEVRSYISDPLKLGIQQNFTQILDGGRIWAWGRNLPAIPDEPFALGRSSSPIPTRTSRWPTSR